MRPCNPMLIVALLLSILIAWRAGSWILEYHKQKLNDEQERTRGYHRAAAILAGEIESAHFARDYYRTALHQIIEVSPPGDAAGDIARRFLHHDQEPAA